MKLYFSYKDTDHIVFNAGYQLFKKEMREKQKVNYTLDFSLA